MDETTNNNNNNNIIIIISPPFYQKIFFLSIYPHREDQNIRIKYEFDYRLFKLLSF